MYVAVKMRLTFETEAVAKDSHFFLKCRSLSLNLASNQGIELSLLSYSYVW